MEASDTSTGTEAPAEATPTTDAPAQEAPATPDVSEQLASLTQRFDRAFPAEPEPTEQPLTNQDLLAALTAEDGEGEYGYDGQPQGIQQDPNAADPEIAALDEYVRERVAEQTGQFQQQIEQRLRQDDLARLAEAYPELQQRDTLDAVRNRLNYVAQRYGEDALTNPGLVEMALLAERASRAAANETPASQAAGQGATLETQAGAGGDPGSPSPEDQIIQDMLAGGSKSAFG